MRPTLIENKRYILLNRATMEPCSHYLCGDNAGSPCVYDFRELADVKRVLWERSGVEAVEREIQVAEVM